MLLRYISRRIFHRLRVTTTNNIRYYGNNRDSTTAAKLKWSYYQGQSEVPLLGATIGQLLEQMAEKSPLQEAIVSSTQGLRCNFEELLERCDEFAAGLMSIGVRRGDRVGIWSPNCMEWVIAQYGTARAGMILVNINPAYQAGELQYALNKVGIKALIAAEHYKTQDYYGMLQKICPELEHSVPGDLCSKVVPDLKSLIMISEKNFPGALRFSDVHAAAMNKFKTDIKDMQRVLQFDDPINIQFTSGTTGVPKGATLSHHNVVNNALYVGRTLGYHEQEARICMPVPLYHCFGMVLGCMMSVVHGATVILPSPAVDPEATLNSVQSERCTALYGTPTMFIDVLHLPNFEDFDVTSLSTGIMAGSPCPVEVMKQVITKLHMSEVTAAGFIRGFLEVRFSDVQIAYGTTETSPVSFMTYRDDPLEKQVSTVGRALSNTEVKIVDDDGIVTPVNVPGELCIRGYCVKQNYWDDPGKTAEVIGADRWYRTGDLAVIDEDGFGRIVGRIKDMIVRGGENIYPAEVEGFLYKHPKINDVQVVGVPDKRLGEQTCAWIKLKDGETATEQEIKDFCKGQISHFKIPHYITFVTEFPLTVTGKVQKFIIREKAIKIVGINDD